MGACASSKETSTEPETKPADSESKTKPAESATSMAGKSVDLEFDLTLDEHLAKNEYPEEKMAKFQADETHCSDMAKVMTKEMFDKYKDHKTKNAGWTIARAINTGVLYPSSYTGCHAGDLESYYDYKDLFHPLIERYHAGFKVEESKHTSDLDPSKIETELSESAKKKVISTRIRVARNLGMFPLNPGGTLETRQEILKLVEKAANNFSGILKGKVYKHEVMSDAERQKLVDDHYLFRGKDKMQAASGYHEHWPKGRGIFVNDDQTKKFLLWINEGDHLRIISMQPGADVKEVFSRLHEAIEAVKSSLQKETGKPEVFMVDETLGNITCCPTNIGTGMRGSVHILLPKLIKKIGFDEIDKLARSMNCQARGSTGEHSQVIDRIDISNLRRLGFPEYQLVNDMIRTANELARLEDEA